MNQKENDHQPWWKYNQGIMALGSARIPGSENTPEMLELFLGKVLTHLSTEDVLLPQYYTCKFPNSVYCYSTCHLCKHQSSTRNVFMIKFM